VTRTTFGRGSFATSEKLTHFLFVRHRSSAEILRALLVSIDGIGKVKSALQSITCKWANRKRKEFSRAEITKVLQVCGKLSDHDLENLEDAIESFVHLVIATPDSLNSNFEHWTDRLRETICRRGLQQTAGCGGDSILRAIMEDTENTSV
jgi:ribosomal protein S13